jgi:alpha-tubulin suppressor-like RCC1 family protein
MLELPFELLTAVCLHLDPRALVRFAAVCRRFRHGDDGLETLEMPTKSPVVTALHKHVLSEGALIPSTRPVGSFESWVAYLARYVRQRRCLESPPIAMGNEHSLFVDAAGWLLSCGGYVTGHPRLDIAMPGVRVRSMAAGSEHSLVLGWDGRVYSWGRNNHGQLGKRDRLDTSYPVTVVEGLEGVRSVSAAVAHSHAVTRSGDVFSWGERLLLGTQDSLRLTIVEGFGEVLVRTVWAGHFIVFAISQDGDLYSWGHGSDCVLVHGDTDDQPLPKRVEALRGVSVSSAAIAYCHTLALAKDGRVYTWGEERCLSHGEREDLPTLLEALRGVHVVSVAVHTHRRYAVTDTGELWAWGFERYAAPLGHGEHMACHMDGHLPKPIESLQDIKVDAVAVGENHTFALADDGSVYPWGDWRAINSGALGLRPLPLPSEDDAGLQKVAIPQQRIPALRVACGV